MAQLLKLGDMAFANSEFSSAVRHYTSAIGEGPATLRQPANRLAFEGFGSPPTLFHLHADVQETVPLLYTKRAAAYISLRSLAQALRDLNKAVELDSKFIQVSFNTDAVKRQPIGARAIKCKFNCKVPHACPPAKKTPSRPSTVPVF